MATSETMYCKVLLDNHESQRTTRFVVVKLGTAFVAGSCLVLLSIVAIFAGVAPYSTSAAESTTSLIGLQSSLRTSRHMTLQTAVNRFSTASPWGELALAGIKEANHCGRGASMNTNALNNVLSSMNGKFKAAVNVVVRAAAEKKKEFNVTVRKTPEEILKAGATGPLGYWDPVGFATDLSEGRLLFYREVELKHGRVCMLASLGFLVAEKFHPLFGGNIDVPSYVAFQATPLQDFWLAAAAAVALPEILASIPTFNEPSEFGDWAFTMKSDRVPGDLGFDPLGLKPKSEKDFLELQNKELNNGRLAMFAITGMIGQELATGKALR